MTDSLSTKFKVLDRSLSEAAFRSVNLENPFNLTSKQAKEIAAVIGCDYFLLIRSGTLRRSSFAKPEYNESYATIFVVSGRTGRLVFWDLKTFEADSPAGSEKSLYGSGANFAVEIADKILSARAGETAENPGPAIDEVPVEGSPEARNFRPPLPYRRIKPEYTREAYLYDIRATVDILVDIDETGGVVRTEIVRWAGFGLDASVVNAVRKMNWRAAERNGRTLPMRVLLRYNFMKIEKDQTASPAKGSSVYFDGNYSCFVPIRIFYCFDSGAVLVLADNHPVHPQQTTLETGPVTPLG